MYNRSPAVYAWGSILCLCGSPFAVYDTGRAAISFTHYRFGFVLLVFGSAKPAFEIVPYIPGIVSHAIETVLNVIRYVQYVFNTVC